MTQHALALIIDDIKEGKKLSKVLNAYLWSSFAIE